jgi:arylsulfatase A-like enzyme
MMAAVDDLVFNVTQALKQKGMYENTLIVFASDNGELLL